MTWFDAFLRTLKDNEVRLVAYVPDNVLAPLIEAIWALDDNQNVSRLAALTVPGQ